MGKLKKPDHKSYEKIITAFRKSKKGLTISDVSAHTGLPLYQVKELVPVAADEYSARLVVTETSEILYSFPHGMKSRYRGIGPTSKRFFSGFARVSGAALAALFKAWIMVMLIGYFLLFMALALASVVVSVSANSGSRGRRGRGGTVSTGLFNTILRLWFYSELFGSGRSRSGSWQGRRKAGGRPLHRAIFSFVFGEEDPNRDSDMVEKKAFIAYLRGNRGVVSLPELMALNGISLQDASERIGSYCLEFSGTPEITEGGTLVYRFDEILMSAESSAEGKFSTSLGSISSSLRKKLRVFSSNPKNMNIWFILINGVNLLFGAYFLRNASVIGDLALAGAGLEKVPQIYGVAYYVLARLGAVPLPAIRLFLGIVPLAFSLLFWAIPAIRSFWLSRENKKLRLANYRSLGFGRIWENPDIFKPADFSPTMDECLQDAPESAGTGLVKEIGSYSTPEVALDDRRNEVYSFPGLRREKDALDRYRQLMQPASSPGKAIFDSGD